MPQKDGKKKKKQNSAEKDKKKQDQGGSKEQNTSQQSPAFLGQKEVSSTSSKLTEVNSHVQVKAKPGESAESLIRRFHYKVRESGIMDKLEEIRFYEKPSKKKQKEEKLREKKIARAQKYNRW